VIHLHCFYNYNRKIIFYTEDFQNNIMELKMEDDFFVDNMIIYIEKEITKRFSSDSIFMNSKI